MSYEDISLDKCLYFVGNIDTLTKPSTPKPRNNCEPYIILSFKLQ